MAMLFKEATDILRKISSVNSLKCLLNNIVLLNKFFICVNIFFTYLFNKKNYRQPRNSSPQEKEILRILLSLWLKETG